METDNQHRNVGLPDARDAGEYVWGNARAQQISHCQDETYGKAILEVEIKLNK